VSVQFYNYGITTRPPRLLAAAPRGGFVTVSLRAAPAEGNFSPMAPPTAAAQLTSFLAKYTPAMHAEMKAAHAKVRTLVPGAVEVVYDNWNGTVVGFGPTERASEAVLSLIVLPDHVTTVRNKLVIKSVSAEQRPRRPAK
jgi:hypothetical protein